MGWVLNGKKESNRGKTPGFWPEHQVDGGIVFVKREILEGRRRGQTKRMVMFRLMFEVPIRCPSGESGVRDRGLS